MFAPPASRVRVSCSLTPVHKCYCHFKQPQCTLCSVVWGASLAGHDVTALSWGILSVVPTRGGTWSAFMQCWVFVQTNFLSTTLIQMMI